MSAVVLAVGVVVLWGWALVIILAAVMVLREAVLAVLNPNRDEP